MSKGAYTSFWNAWGFQEFKVQEGGVGDYYGLVNVLIDIPSEKKEENKEFDYVKGGNLNPFSSLQRFPTNHYNKDFDNKKPHGK